MSELPALPCLSCGAPLAGAYCAACGQRAVDLAAPTWQVAREALGEAVDVDGRILRTARALRAPGLLTVEFLRGRRAPYLGPVKLLLLAGTALTTTWIATRGIDGHYYGFAVDRSTVAYIDAVVRGTIAGSVGVAVVSWAMDRGRRRLLDDAVFALHLVAAVSFGAVVVLWLATLWKLVWGTAATVPAWMPALPYLFFVPAAVAGMAYVAVAIRRVYGGAWWAAVLRALVLAAVGLAAVTAIVLTASRQSA